MKKLLICGVIAASFGFTAAHAGTASQAFDVTAALTTKCVANNGTTTPAVAFTYTAFQTGSATATPASISFKCSRNLAITSASFASGSAVSSYSGVVAGLAYTINLTGGTTPSGGSDATTTTAAVADNYTYSVTGTMGAGQAGQSGASATDSQTLYISF